MPEAHNLDHWLASLRSEDPKERDAAASVMSDYFDNQQLDEVAYRSLVTSLLHQSTVEHDPVVTESIYYALATASMSSYSALIDWSLIAAAMPNLDLQCLEHALVILGFSGQPQYRA